MEWTVVTVIIALIGLGAAIVKPIVSLTNTITKLTVAVERLRDDLDLLTTKNSKSHERLWEHNEVQDDILKNHEKRLTNIERAGQRAGADNGMA